MLLSIVPRMSLSIEVIGGHLTIDHSFCYIVNSSQNSLLKKICSTLAVAIGKTKANFKSL
jgi:hypothetical protein